MPQTLEVVVRMTISDEDFDVNRLERRVRKARDQAGRELGAPTDLQANEYYPEFSLSTCRQQRNTLTAPNATVSQVCSKGAQACPEATHGSLERSRV